MGCGQSVKFVVNEYELGHNEESIKFYESLDLSAKELDYLDQAFRHIDVDDSKSIRMDEFITYFEADDTDFNRAMFGIFGENKNSIQFSFIEFVAVMWNFLTLPADKISSFAFLLLSAKQEVLRPNQVIELLHTIHTKESLKGHNVRIPMEELKAMHCDMTFNVVEFADFIRQHIFLISPVINMQVALRQNLIGKSYWQKLENKRSKNEDYRDLKYILDMKGRVREIQRKQRKFIETRERREKEKATKERMERDNAKREKRLRHKVSNGARRARNSIVKIVKGNKENSTVATEEEFTDIDDKSPEEMLPASVSGGSNVKTVLRQRTPTILLRNANLARQEKRAKQEHKKQIAEVLKSPDKKKKRPGRFTIAFQKKSQKRSNPGMQISPTKE